MTATTTLTCRNCGDSFTAPERPCPKPSPGREYKETGRGGHMFYPPDLPPPPEPMSKKRLQEIARLCSDFRFRVGEPSAATDAYRAVPELLAEIGRLRAECKRLQRVGLESARIGGDPVFTREQIERLMEIEP